MKHLKWLIPLVLLALLLAPAAMACPGCKEAVAGAAGAAGDGGADGGGHIAHAQGSAAAGFSWSILFMLGVVFSLIGTATFGVYRIVRAENARAAASATPARVR